MMRSGVFAIPDFSQLESESGYYSSRSPDRNCGPGSHRDPVTATDWLAGCSNRDPATHGNSARDQDACLGHCRVALIEDFKLMPAAPHQPDWAHSEYRDRAA